jgi:hypothetical protein
MLALGLWCLVPGIPVSSSNKADHHDITEILLKVALNTITITLHLLLVKAEHWGMKNVVPLYDFLVHQTD